MSFKKPDIKNWFLEVPWLSLAGKKPFLQALSIFQIHDDSGLSRNLNSVVLKCLRTLYLIEFFLRTNCFLEANEKLSGSFELFEKTSGFLGATGTTTNEATVMK